MVKFLIVQICSFQVLSDFFFNQFVYADDTIRHRNNINKNDEEKLQKDLDNLASWEENFNMKFHPSKCNVLHFSRARKPKTTTYSLHGQLLERVEQAKYLGVTLSSKATWDTHIENSTNKANKTLGFLRRNRITSSKAKSTAYKIIVRPILEYACAVWDPHTTKNVKALEALQRRAARWALNRHRRTSSVR